MALPMSLYEWSASAPAVPSGLPLVMALTGFTDAGSAASGLVDYFREELEPQPIAIFQNDVLLDYRA
ncbi:MAG: PAC2 family protein, partial [Actinobacteria bacterium]|nr:PAC2 family protein [Actinomycetota bacterium]